jgi:hypothetical protein
MPDKRPPTLRQIDQARGDLCAIADDLDFINFQLSGLPTRAYFCRTPLMATASVWMLLGALGLWLAR